MNLHSRVLGTGSPILILHGLFGMLDNWLAIGRPLAEAGFAVHLLDLRNHGRSPHADSHRYTDMADDLLEYLEAQGLDDASIIGHSMGGKLAMIFTLLNPEKVRRLVLADIAPSDYRSPENSYHEKLITTLRDLDLSHHSSLRSIHEELAKQLGDRPLAMFLAKNIVKTPEGYDWRCNLPVLQRHMRHLMIGLADLEAYAPCPVPALFLKGNQSSYVLPKHDPDRRHFFPNSQILGIDGAGHWLHSDQPAAVLAALLAFFGTKP